MDLPEFLTNPVVLVALAIIMRAGLAWQRSLSWPEYRLLHGLKRAVFPILQRYDPTGFREWVNRKGGRDGPEYVRTVPGGIKDVAGHLRAAGGSLHLLNSIKRRPPGHGDVLSGAHLVWTHADGTQTEVYLFDNDGPNGVDVYAHHETSVTDPEGHLSDGQTDGDPRNVVSLAFPGRGGA
jgi:hypothetical protein